MAATLPGDNSVSSESTGKLNRNRKETKTDEKGQRDYARPRITVKHPTTIQSVSSEFIQNDSNRSAALGICPTKLHRKGTAKERSFGRDMDCRRQVRAGLAGRIADSDAYTG